MRGKRKLTFYAAKKCLGTPLCTRCWRYGHRSAALVCPFKAMLCAVCSGPHSSEHHREMASCCKAKPKATPPVEATPAGEDCPHPPRCVNCSLDHKSNDRACHFWKHRFDAKWIFNKYKSMKVGAELLKFAPPSDSPFPRIPGYEVNPRSLRYQLD